MRLKSYWILVQNIHVLPIFNSPPFFKEEWIWFPLKGNQRRGGFLPFPFSREEVY